MWLIVGLGNPGKEYEKTRHNVGFLTLDAFARDTHSESFKETFSGLTSEANFEEERIFLLKPLTYMNVSGRAVRELVDYYKIPPLHCMVIHDDIDLSLGQIRIKFDGGDGGHKGVRSIIEQLNSPNFIRIRIGVEKQSNVTKHVLSGFSKKEKLIIEEAIERGVEAIKMILKDGYIKAMNRFNYYKKKDE